MPAFRDKAATKEFGRRLDKLIACRTSRETLDPEMSRWIDELPEPMRKKLGRIGLIDSRRLAASMGLLVHLADFKEALLARGRTPQHASRTAQYARRVIEGCGFRFLADIEASPVERFLRKLREEPNGIGIETSNHLTQALRQFCRWTVETGRAPEFPLSTLKRLNPAADRRRERRALSLDETKKLLESTSRGPERFGLSGPERALLYRVALQTGLRANEIRSLCRASFDLGASPPTVTVEAAYSKHRREDVIPLRNGLAMELAPFLAERLPLAPAFSIPKHWRSSEMIQEDLKDAGIPFVDESGRVVDFHALRHTFITNLARSRVHPKTAQKLARHASITTTLDRYTHSLWQDEVQALESLPDLCADHARHTGTAPAP